MVPSTCICFSSGVSEIFIFYEPERFPRINLPRAVSGWNPTVTARADGTGTYNIVAKIALR